MDSFVPIICKQLEDMGAAAIMPLGSLIGSGRGIQNRFNISIIKNQAKVPVIVDAGIGCASDAAIAMELGCDGVLINTAVAEAKNPILMAEAMKDAVIAGRKSLDRKSTRLNSIHTRPSRMPSSA